MGQVDYASFKEKLLGSQENGDSSGDYWLEHNYPHLYALFKDSGKSKQGKAGFSMSVCFIDHWWTVALNWREAGKVAFVNLSGLEHLFDDLERRLSNGQVQWRPCNYSGR